MTVVFFGSFYLINLVLAVVALSYEQEAENVANRVRYRIFDSFSNKDLSNITFYKSATFTDISHNVFDSITTRSSLCSH